MPDPTSDAAGAKTMSAIAICLRSSLAHVTSTIEEICIAAMVIMMQKIVSVIRNVNKAGYSISRQG